uniref:Mediator of RNA polymerase II transcription subunit 6 n=1 Tax=Kwoniella bestiolae CBS 10118 TaxID=1296100 RepID=A0A1B9G2V3_9TREE|nr:hypothetical protein I302_05171 [Kwoniella bestiolae CBS 10118]OCF25353.1 hypothetical protein I302_05171 [Kwoniella bestiolae CBS 10118]
MGHRMDYFAYSPFWDSKSNNNVLRTQRRVENPTYGHAEEKIELNAFKSGFEYIVSHSQPPELFVIQKREVDPSGKRDRVTGSWFILQERIYQSPTVYDVVSARLRNASHLIFKTLTSLSESHPSSNPRSTTLWRSLPPQAVSKPTSYEPLIEDQPNPNSDETLEADPQKKEDKEKEEASFDWHLYHSLQSTRQALPGLDEMSRNPVSRINPMEELRSIEAQLTAQFGITPSNPQVRPPGSIRSNSVRGTPGTSLPMGISPGMIIGQTPNLGGLNVASPRNLMGMSPGGISVGRATSIGNAGSPANMLQ